MHNFSKLTRYFGNKNRNFKFYKVLIISDLKFGSNFIPIIAN